MTETITQEENPFASLFSSDSEEPTTSEQEPQVGKEKTNSPTDEELDLFGNAKPKEDDETWDGKTPFHEHPAIKKRLDSLNAQAEREAERAKQAEAEVKKLREIAGVPQQYYTKFENPAQQFTEDMALLDALGEHAANPKVKAVIDFVLANSPKTGIMEDKTVRETKNSTTEPEASKSDQRLEKLLRQQVSTQVSEALSKSRILPQFQKALAKHVVENADLSSEITAADMQRLVKEGAAAFGWSDKDLLGDATDSKSKPTGGTPRNSTGPQKGKEERRGNEDDSKPQTADEVREALKNRFRTLVESSKQ